MSNSWLCLLFGEMHKLREYNVYTEILSLARSFEILARFLQVVKILQDSCKNYARMPLHSRILQESHCVQECYTNVICRSMSVDKRSLKWKTAYDPPKSETRLNKHRSLCFYIFSMQVVRAVYVTFQYTICKYFT